MRLAGFSALSHPRPELRTALLALLALVAVLVCMVFAHPGGDGQDVNLPAVLGPLSISAPESASASVAVAEAVTLAAAVAVAKTAATTGMARTIAASIGQRVLCFEGNSLGGGVMAGMSCSFLLVLAGLLVIAGGPSALGLLFLAGGFVVGTFRAIPLHLHRPSLTQLSISRT